MKKYKLIKYLLIFSLVFSLTACDDKNESEFDAAVNPESLDWQATTSIDVTAVEDKQSFVWLTDAITFEEFWGNDVIELNLQLKSAQPLADFSKIDFFMTLQEENGFNGSPPYDTNGILYSSVTEIPESGQFNLSISADEVISIFGSNFQTARTSAPLLEGDVFILNWVITHTDGSTFDSRTKVQPGSSRGLTVVHDAFTPPGFVGTFKYEWIALSDGGASYGGVSIGDKGTQKFTLESVDGVVGTSSAENLMFGYYYGGPGQVSYNYSTGETNVIDTSWREQKWNITNIDGPSLDIELEYYYSAGYDEYGTVRVTRTDGNDWPTNTYIPQAYPWGGTFNYEWLVVSGGASFDKTVGDTGSITSTDLADGQWTVSNLLFNYYYGYDGVLTYDAATGLTSVEGSDDAVWTISNVTDTTLDIAWTYYYTANYDESGTVRLTRTDGKTWPSNIYTE